MHGNMNVKLYSTLRSTTIGALLNLKDGILQNLTVACT